ncbi:hypothetical protein AAFF_G00407840 [Aldrovandia affinis]|uniref:Uncharacterized protein n=1 Tax=Aldrovandia affinis TaxID=143900 RepID=A0AAD7SBV3_9TELE|nr:hypothetical protein AAFF_G00407840 [Aldrovandia affinis]
MLSSAERRAERRRPRGDGAVRLVHASRLNTVTFLVFCSIGSSSDSRAVTGTVAGSAPADRPQKAHTVNTDISNAHMVHESLIQPSVHAVSEVHRLPCCHEVHSFNRFCLRLWDRPANAPVSLSQRRSPGTGPDCRTQTAVPLSAAARSHRAARRRLSDRRRGLANERPACRREPLLPVSGCDSVSHLASRSPMRKICSVSPGKWDTSLRTSRGKVCQVSKTGTAISPERACPPSPLPDSGSPRSSG